MTLVRAAFETETNVVLFAVLCAGCFKSAKEKRDSRCWTSPVSAGGVECEFCLEETRKAL